MAGLLLQGVDSNEWDRLIRQENILQKRTANTAASYAQVARSRLQTMTVELWELVRDGSLHESTWAILAATVKFSPLLGDFLRNVVRSQFRRFATELGPHQWDEFIDDCQRSHPDMPHFTESTKAKLRQNAMRILHEAGFIHDTKNLRLRSVHIEPAVQRYLENHNEMYVLDCLKVCP